jgi:DNA replication protein DnaC
VGRGPDGRAQAKETDHRYLKTHLAVGLGLQAIRNGYGVYFVTAHELIEDLRKAYNEQRLDRRLRIYRAPKVLIIDEMGVYAMDQLGAGLFFQLVAARYEKSSIILTSNKGFAEWGDVLGDPVIATAVLDRLLHHSHILNIKGDSYRLREKRKAGLLPSPFAHEQAALHSRGG